MGKKKFETSNKALYITTASASGIGVILFTYAMASLVSGLKPTGVISFIVWALVFLLFAVFVFSLIYVVLDYGQATYQIHKSTRLNDSDKEKSFEEHPNENQNNVVPVVADSTLLENTLISANHEVVDSNPNNNDIKSKRESFKSSFVTFEFKGRPVYDVFVQLLELKSGGKNFVEMFFAAKTKKWINQIPKYKDACFYFGAEYIGSKSNFSTQMNQKLEISDSDLLSMCSILDDKLKEIEMENNLTL